MAVEVKYNDTVIASLEAGQTATLQCANKKAASDITITFVLAGTITYNGTETAVEAGKTATFKCAGKKMLSDITVVIAEVKEEPTRVKLEAPVIELVIEGEETDETQLTAPAIELDGATLNIYDDEGIATSYDILVDGVVMDTVEVSAEPALPVWNGTDLTGTTWHIPAGWTATAGYGKFSDLNYGFAINGEDYGSSGWSYLCIGYYGNEVDWYGKTNSIAYSLPSEITDDSSITLTFTGGTDATNASLIAWLKENGELTSHIMPDPVLISFTVKGTSYQAEEIMTWAQWCDSDYNTQGAYLSSTANGQAVHWDGGDGVSFNAVCTVDSTTVLETDIVMANHAYSTKSVRHMGGAG